MPTLSRLSNSFAAAIAVAGFAIGVAAHGEVLTSNVSDVRDGGSDVNSSFKQRAQQFSTTATGTQITTVKLNATSFGTPDQPFSIELYSTSGGTSGLPDTRLLTIFSGTGGDLPALHTDPLFTVSGLAIDLAPSTKYFIVMQSGSGSTFQGNWSYNIETTGSGAGFRPDNAFTQATLNAWEPDPVSVLQPYRMEIIAIPEPPAIVLSGIGLASAICLLRRRQT